MAARRRVTRRVSMTGSHRRKRVDDFTRARRQVWPARPNKMYLAGGSIHQVDASFVGPYWLQLI